MSRFEVPGQDPAMEVFVGWDHPLQTFFGQVYRRDRRDRDDALIHWVGAARPRELPEIDDLQRAMREHVVLAPEARSRLYNDRDEGR